MQNLHIKMKLSCWTEAPCPHAIWRFYLSKKKTRALSLLFDSSVHLMPELSLLVINTTDWKASEFLWLILHIEKLLNLFLLFFFSLQDSDASIRKRALELVYLLINESNAKPLTKELIDYLEVSDQEFKGDLTAKICSIVAK